MSTIFNFFCMPHELAAVWEWVGEQPGMKFVELDSRPGRSNREFEKFPRDVFANAAYSIGAWPSLVGGSPKKRFIRFNFSVAVETRAFGHTALSSPAILRFSQVRAPQPTLIGPTELSFWTEKLARRSAQFSDDEIDSVDWIQMKGTVDAIKKYIKSAASGNWRSTPVLPDVAAWLKTPSNRLWLWGDEGTL